MEQSGRSPGHFFRRRKQVQQPCLGVEAAFVTAGTIVPLYRGHNGIWDIDSTTDDRFDKAEGQGEAAEG
jgi:hypothetical protein